ncbi:GGDEF domain-containing protein [Aliiglaciecola lipolytica]|uniref:diguanylate cyclase n=1 Tax=Aliiglaciecola lipolytica E3 TaxID=1127673 RepID=K6YNP8_9ALTE|nr:GGDEF domain-containing protein [Aliiglaciecola lipolytica]GAC12970.1 diguanylate cyclase [Aliiglaciecola lipolytica E3]
MFNKLRKWMLAYLDIGTNGSRDREDNQQIFVSNLFSFIGYTITFALAVGAILNANTLLAISLFSASLLFFLAHQIHRVKSIKNTYKISTRIVFVSLLFLMLYLVYSGGYANTGPLWIYILPPVAFFFGGLRKGLINIGLFIILVSGMLFYPNDMFINAVYSYEFKSRLIYSFLTVTLLFGFYEFSRQRFIRFIQTLSDQFEQQAMHDPLTQLPNRRAMGDYLHHEFNRAQRSQKSMSLLLCDIDHFKKINDIHGHEGGDYALKALADLFTNTLRKQDKISRWGGEEFLFLLPETTGNEAHILAEKIRKKVAKHEFTYAQKTFNITLSIGVKEVSQQMSIDKAISAADNYLYQAKENGRNRTMPETIESGAD